MSLINDMLKDLDGRRADEQVGLTADIPASGRRIGKRMILPVLAAVAVLYFLIVYMDLFGLFRDRDDLTAEKIPEPISMNSRWLHVEVEQGAAVTLEGPSSHVTAAHSDAVPSADENRDVTATESGGVGGSPNERQTADLGPPSGKTDSDAQMRSDTEVAKLLREAEAALQRDHLMTPSQRNAYQLFNAVLVLDKAHPEAVQGLMNIHDRYIALAEEAQSRGDRAQADLFVRRAEMIAPVPDAIRVGLIQDSRESSTSVDPPTKRNPTKRKTLSNDKIKIQPVSRLSDSQWVDRLRSNSSTHVLEEVFDLLEQGRELPLTTHFLADQFVRENQPHQLKKLARWVPIDSAGGLYVAAQQAIMAEDFHSVKSILRNVGTQNPVAADELRLRSAVCQKMRDYQCAARGYQELVGSPFSDINDWLGAAVSLDALRRSHGALSAYQRVADVPHPDPAIADFARRRAAELSSMLLRR